MKKLSQLSVSFSRVMVLGSGFCIAVLLTGCHSLNVTQPDRSATEQLLLSTAADRAVIDVDLSSISGRKVYVEEKYFESYDSGYAMGTLRQLISSSGCFIMEDLENAEIIIEVRSGGLGIDRREMLFGIPALVVPIPFAGDFGTPELALYKSEKSDSVGKFALFAYERESGAFEHATGSMAGTAKFHYYKFLGFFSWRTTDIPELDPKLLERMKSEE